MYVETSAQVGLELSQIQEKKQLAPPQWMQKEKVVCKAVLLDTFEGVRKAVNTMSA